MTETKKELTKFEQLCELNVNEHCEKKSNGSKDLTYLSWTWAWKYFKTQFPDATYTVKHWDGVPYHYDSNLGYMCETEITAGGETYGMWLPVMDGANKAQKAESYTYRVKRYKDKAWTGAYDEKTVEPATMFDINTTIMRCLVKNMAMFGLGLYIYSGEDIPELSETTIENQKADAKAKLVGDMKDRIATLLSKLDPTVDTSKFATYKNLDSTDALKAMGLELKALVDTQGAGNANN